MAKKSEAQKAREQADAKLREERAKATQRSGRTAADEAWKEKLRQQQEEQDRRDTFDENYDV
ncbi:hypothetical protein [Streptomyces natalensis]|uniref:Uncharacterized protein n=1 Tax=Streptomyces natalensis ATCC 27448 TaxID=1240678 RepID=A0A0D7CJZ8_9ACTN|nr:hypothetical protein [Streptomyces natalensis]KIZ16533.1 hypothetical protein SNA_19665 [Streptomyces natalensis ATCC 27448]